MHSMKKIFFLKERLSKLKPRFNFTISDASSKTMDLMNKFTIRKRLVLFFLLASLGPMSIIGIISYISSRSAIDSKISKYSQKGLSQTIQNLEIKLQGIEDVSKQLIAMPQYNNALKEYVEAQDLLGIYLKSQAVNDLLQSLSFSNNENCSISFISIKDPTRYVSIGVISSNDLLKRLYKSKFYQNILDQGGKAVWSQLSLDQNKDIMVVGRRINDRVSGDPIGVIFIFIKENIFSNLINSIDTSEADKGISNEFTMVVDSNGLVIISPFEQDLNQNITKLLSDPRKMKSLLANKKDSDSFLVKLKKSKVRIISKEIGNRGWYILNVSKTSYLYFESNMVGWITLFLGALFGIIAVFISIIIALSISNPLNQVIYSMRQAEKGDLTVRSNVKRNDELGYLGASFDHMIEKIADLLKETKKAIEAVAENSTVLQESSEQSVTATEAVAAAMEEISKGTMEQTSEAEKSSITMNDLASQIEVVVSKAKEVENISGSTRDLSLRSKEAVEQLIHKTNETDQITQTIIQNIIDLNTSAGAIRDITEVITGIAEQTNLLGLNASIEAARAGEMGQGFAVVSEEVNKLAIQSRDAAKTINNILQNIQAKTQISTRTAEQAHSIIEEQRNAVNSAQEAFSEITTATGDIIARIIFMNHLINNINSSKQRTVQSIMNISAISEQTAASAQEVSASTEEQTALAEQVRMLAKELQNKSEELAIAIAMFQV
jgi:methyl-accepting chemotaxis protein